MSNLCHQSEALGNTVFNKTNRAKIKSSYVLLIFQSFVFVFYTFLLGIAMVKYCAVAVCRDGTHNRPDLTYFAFPEDNTRLGKESGSCSVIELTKSSRVLSIRGSVPHIFKTTDMTVSDSGSKSVTGCPTIFDPTSTKTTSARENRHDRHEKRQTRRADQGPTAKKSCTKTLKGMIQRIVRESLST